MTDATPSVPAADPGAFRVMIGHGTQNDFVLVDDREGTVELTAATVRALADRRAGLGADGVIRLVPSSAVDEGAAALVEDPAAVWFMDYRNGDGSIAEMCGNGVRVVARFAEELGLWDGTGVFALATRAGVKRVHRVDAEPAGAPAGGPLVPWYAVDMGPWRIPGGGAAVAAGGDAEVRAPGLAVDRPGLSVDLGNPHTVVVLADEAELAAVDLTREPEVSPVPPSGTNVELVVPGGEAVLADGSTAGTVRMRVHERGVGETRSCGTGACAAALAVRAWGGPDAPDVWRVEVPGGVLRVRVAGDRVELAGPAVLVADVVVRPDGLVAV